jgi:predicted RNA-binding Zn ribbon-like protein
MTGQWHFDRYADAGMQVAVDLVNVLVVEPPPPEASTPAIADALAVDPPSVDRLQARHGQAFVELARRLREVLDRIDDGDVDAAAELLNVMLADHPAHPHLAKEDGAWRLHHHPADLALVPMWTAICAEALARLIATGQAGRLGICDADDCDRAYLDRSRNASRRFCSTTCQNRVKAAAFRARRAAP